MFSSNSLSRGAVIGTALVFALLGFVDAQAHDRYPGNPYGAARSLTVDVAENPFRFSFDTSGPLLDDGTPAYGNAFVTQGYIYPKGTLGAGESGVEDDGKPSYPERVLGEWTCRGVFVGEGFATVSGPVVETTQLFSFYRSPGYDPDKLASAVSIVNEGFELADTGIPVDRAITGGTGRFRHASGESRQVLLGLSDQMAVSLRVRFRIAK